MDIVSVTICVNLRIFTTDFTEEKKVFIPKTPRNSVTSVVLFL